MVKISSIFVAFLENMNFTAVLACRLGSSLIYTNHFSIGQSQAYYAKNPIMCSVQNCMQSVGDNNSDLKVGQHFLGDTLPTLYLVG